MNQRRRTLGVGLTLGVLAPVTLAACGTSGGSGGSANTITYWLWDSAQQPGYQKCADEFHKANPDLTVQITQYGWDNYWQKLTAGFIAGNAPDVFTDHLSKFAQFADLKVLRPLDDLAPTAGVRDSDYQGGLAQLWKGKDGKRYGTPKDWDTVAMFYDKAALKAAGVDASTLSTLTWNPKDGGTFEKLIAHLTVDRSGKRGDEPGFDKTKVKVYGLASDGAGGTGWGQTQWSAFTGSTGWTVTDKNPWGTHFNLDDPRFQDTLSWYFGLVKKGYMPTYQQIGGGGGNTVRPDKQIQSGSAVMGISGSWMISTYTKITNADGKKIAVGVAPTPIGPSGKRSSMFNGLADSITTQARNPEGAAKWVAFLSGETCQDVIGESGVVFPARPKGTELAIAYNRKERGLDVSAFTDQVKDKSTFLFPVTSNAADIVALVNPAMDDVYIGTAPVSSLTNVNATLNKLFEVVG